LRPDALAVQGKEGGAVDKRHRYRPVGSGAHIEPVRADRDHGNGTGRLTLRWSSPEDRRIAYRARRPNLTHVPYRGAPPALTDLIAGQVQVIFDVLPSSIGYIRAGKLRALAVTTAARLEMLPDIPTVGEFVPGYEASGWIGVGTPKNTPTEIVDKLNKEINVALADPKIRARIADLGSPVFASSPAEFANFIAAETEKWGKVVKFARIKPQ
jgi:tripartite-type tricarboxylate transporter receptor subunit TctC